MQIRIKIKSLKLLPVSATPGSSGYDLFANLQDAHCLDSGEYFLVPTGIEIEMPLGFEAQIRPRSGLAVKHGITILNAPGTIDADYRGEISVVLINFGKEKFIIEPSMRIAQVIFSKIIKPKFLLANKLHPTSRSCNGFGSTGDF